MTSDINLLGPIVRQQGFTITGPYDTGYSVKNAGNVNADQYADIIIGAPSANSGAGAAYVVFGQMNTMYDIDLLNMHSSYGFTIYGSHKCGHSVSGADDISITGQGFSITRKESGDQLGFSVSGAGDVNADGYDDIIIGAYRANGKNTGHLQRGVSYIIFGKQGNFTNINLANELDLKDGFAIIGAAPSDQIGYSVSGAGDFNNDGFDDFIIGAPVARSLTGMSYLIFGKAKYTEDIYLDVLDTDQGFFIFGARAGDLTGSSVNRIGDINNDGFDDIIIGAPGASSSSGRSYVLFGKKNDLSNNIFLADFKESQGFTITGSSLYGFSGNSVSGARDLNRDGVNDFLIGAAGESSVYAILGTTSGYKNINLADLASSNIAISGYIPNTNTGFSVSGAGDINNDGFYDIIIGEYNPRFRGSDIMATHVIFGGSKGFTNINLNSLTIPIGFSITGASYSVSSAGDVNGDGFDDILIGDPYKNYTGVSYIIFGRASNFTEILLSDLTNDHGFLIEENLLYYDSEGIGYSVSGAGDINDDGFDDILIGCISGGSYLIFGKKTLDNINLNTLDPDDGFYIYSSLYTGYGTSVSDAGDVDCDGIDDMIIGFPASEDTPGIVYVIFGKRAIPSDFSSILYLDSLSKTEGFSITGTDENGDALGFSSVSGAGDVNLDGCDDIIIGANNANSLRGISYVIFGKKKHFSNIDLSTLNINQGFSINGAYIGDQSGTSVSGVGDVNNDGYQDVIIGAPQANFAKGASYVIFGKSDGFTDINLDSLSETQGFTIYGAYSGDRTGCSVNGAGDVDGDGVPDLIIGADGANLQSGLSYLLFSELTPSPSIHQDKSTDEFWWQSKGFKIAKPIVISILGSVFSFSAAWFMRQKVAFYILNNWGYEYKLLYYDSRESLKAKEIGLILKYDQITSSNKLFCQARNTELEIEIDHGNNAGISSGLYKVIIQELEKPSTETFVLLESEKNQIRDFLMSRDFVDFSDLGCIRGSIYHLCLIAFKRVHKEKYLHKARIQRSSSLLPEQNPLHEEKDNVVSREEDNGGIELRETNSNIGERINRVKSNAERERAHSIEKSCILLSIDAMMDPEHIRLQNEEFVRFSSQLINFVNEELPNDINWLLSSKSDNKLLFLENVPKGSQAVVLYESPTLKDNFQFASSDSLISSLLSAKQILHNLLLIHYIVQNTLSYLDSNITLSDPLDNKELLISADLVLGNLAAQYLPEQSIMNGMFVSTASTVGYAAKLMAADYLKNQEPSDDPIEFSMQCLSTIAAYSLPVLVNYALTRAILPATQISISTLDTLASSSFGVVKCYNNYKVVYGTEAKSTTADIVVPYIADAIALWSLRGYLNFDVSNTANLMMSIKNTMSVAATTYAAHCFGNMFVDLLTQETKEEYLNPAFSFASNTINDFVNTCYQSATDVSGYITEEVSLIMDYIGMPDLKEDV